MWPVSPRFRTKIEAVKESVKGPCADWITVDASYKRVKKEITKALKKAEEEEPVPKKPRHAGTHSKKRKGRAGTDAENTEDPAEANATVPAKKKRRSKTSKKWGVADDSCGVPLAIEVCHAKWIHITLAIPYSLYFSNYIYIIYIAAFTVVWYISFCRG